MGIDDEELHIDLIEPILNQIIKNDLSSFDNFDITSLEDFEIPSFDDDYTDPTPDESNFQSKTDDACNNLSEQSSSSDSENPFKITSVKSIKTAAEKSKTAVKPTGNPSHECPLCKQLFPRRYDLHKHLRTHTAEGPARITKHPMVQHGQEKYECNYCAKSFMLKQSLTLHLAQTHHSVRPHACPTCGRRFAMRCHLKTHMNVHDDNKPFRCHMCGKTFSYRGTLRRHLLSRHTDDILHACEEHTLQTGVPCTCMENYFLE